MREDPVQVPRAVSGTVVCVALGWERTWRMSTTSCCCRASGGLKKTPSTYAPCAKGFGTPPRSGGRSLGRPLRIWGAFLLLWAVSTGVLMFGGIILALATGKVPPDTGKPGFTTFVAVTGGIAFLGLQVSIFVDAARALKAERKGAERGRRLCKTLASLENDVLLRRLPKPPRGDGCPPASGHTRS